MLTIAALSIIQIQNIPVTMAEQLYHGLKKISARLGLSEPLTRQLISRGLIRAFRLDSSKRAAWCAIESQISEDLKKLPQKMRVNKIL